MWGQMRGAQQACTTNAICFKFNTDCYPKGAENNAKFVLTALKTMEISITFKIRLLKSVSEMSFFLKDYGNNQDYKMQTTNVRHCEMNTLLAEDKLLSYSLRNVLTLPIMFNMVQLWNCVKSNNNRFLVHTSLFWYICNITCVITLSYV